MKTTLAAGVGAVLMVSALLWFFGSLPGQQSNELPAEQWLATGTGLFNEKKYDAAIEALQRIPSGSAEEAKARYYQGSAQMMLMDYEAAADLLEMSLALNSESAGTLYALGVVYFKLGNIKLAKAYFASVVEIDPGNDQARGLLDIMAKLERQQPDAMQAFESKGSAGD